MTLSLAYVVLSALLDVIANLCLACSDGFKNKKYGITAITLIMLAFAILTLAVQDMSLFVAYAVWGALSIVGTLFGAKVFLGHKIHPVTLAGIAVLIGAVVLMKLG